ncbi:molybdopterin-binding aldehyde dehydrogenase-like protein [Streptomyces brevispora]|uniref:Molybdopterin-binding aldehyde dehydrogenase-like protein n=1 Tax=Streptomyces brevispora TaxID=887462 RepID=A0A561V6F6_9ACTN|nr:molybdopterin-binding aldehyde dehydrogenase-like protein [Streptomyces brevispora]
MVGNGAMVLPGDASADAGPPIVSSRTFGAVFVEVGVDPDLGLLRPRRARGVYSVGAVVNERTARSQKPGFTRLEAMAWPGGAHA